MNKAKLSIIIPVYLSLPLHQEFTKECIDSITTQHDHHTYVIVNYSKPLFDPFLDELRASPNITVILNPKGNILSAAWNIGIKSAIKQKSDQILIINNDIVLHSKAIDNLTKYSQNHPQELLISGSEWSNLRTLSSINTNSSTSPHPHFSCFMISPETIKQVGYFDENFQFGYFEDNDFHLRILLSGHVATAIDAAKFYHYGSRTIKVDDKLKNTAQKHYHLNRAYFKEKWGLDMHAKAYDPPESILKECYHHPFNNLDLSLKDWK